MCHFYSTDHILETIIHMDIKTSIIEGPQQQYRLGTVNNRLLGNGGRLKHVLMEPNLALCFCSGSKHLKHLILMNVS